jgi:hypothetical protein
VQVPNQKKEIFSIEILGVVQVLQVKVTNEMRRMIVE